MQIVSHFSKVSDLKSDKSPPNKVCDKKKLGKNLLAIEYSKLGIYFQINSSSNYLSNDFELNYVGEE